MMKLSAWNRDFRFGAEENLWENSGFMTHIYKVARQLFQEFIVCKCYNSINFQMSKIKNPQNKPKSMKNKIDVEVVTEI